MIPVDPDSVIFVRLSTDAGVLAVDAGVLVVPLGNFVEYHSPLVVYARRGGETNRTLGGDEALQNPQLQVDCYADTFEKAKALHDAVYHSLTSIPVQTTIAGHLVHSATAGQARDDDEPLLVGETIPDTLYTLDVSLWLERTP